MKGKRGGPQPGSGRPKGFAALEAERARIMICEKLQTEFMPIVEMAIAQAKEGNKDAREWLTDRAFGKAVNIIDLNVNKSLFDDTTKIKAREAVFHIVSTGDAGRRRQIGGPSAPSV